MPGKAVPSPETVARLRQIASSGGAATRAKFGPEHYREIGRRGGTATANAESRKRKRRAKRAAKPVEAPAPAAAESTPLARFNATIKPGAGSFVAELDGILAEMGQR